MVLYKRKVSKQFKKDYKKIQYNKNLCDKLEGILSILEKGEKLPIHCKDHQLKGNLKEFRECHISPDVLLIYIIVDDELTLYLLRLGSHSELF